MKFKEGSLVRHKVSKRIGRVISGRVVCRNLQHVGNNSLCEGGEDCYKATTYDIDVDFGAIYCSVDEDRIEDVPR